jgi:hypothetical protein
MRFLLKIQQIGDLGYCQAGLTEKTLRFDQDPLIDDLRGSLPCKPLDRQPETRRCNAKAPGNIFDRPYQRIPVIDQQKKLLEQNIFRGIIDDRVDAVNDPLDLDQENMQIIADDIFGEEMIVFVFINNLFSQFQ